MKKSDQMHISNATRSLARENDMSLYQASAIMGMLIQQQYDHNEKPVAEREWSVDENGHLTVAFSWIA